MTISKQLTVALAQIAPVWLNRDLTINKILAAISEADKGAELVIFGETLLPGYPFWLELTGGAMFNSPKQKELHTHYLQQAVNIEEGHLLPICDLARQRKIAVVVGTAERASDR